MRSRLFDQPIALRLDKCHCERASAETWAGNFRNAAADISWHQAFQDCVIMHEEALDGRTLEAQEWDQRTTVRQKTETQSRSSVCVGSCSTFRFALQNSVGSQKDLWKGERQELPLSRRKALQAGAKSS